MRPREDARAAGDGPDVLKAAPVGADLLVQDHVADNLAADFLEGGADVHLRVHGAVGVFHQPLEDSLLHRVGGPAPLLLARDPERPVEALLRHCSHLSLEALGREHQVRGLGLAHFVCPRLNMLAYGRDRLGAHPDGLEELLLREEIAEALDHEDGILGAGDGQVKRAILHLLDRGVDHKLLPDHPDPHARHRLLQGDVRDRKRRPCSRYGEGLRRVDPVEAEHPLEHLRVEGPPLAKHRPEGAVHQPRCEHLAVLLPAVALDEAAACPSSGTVALHVLHGERQERPIARLPLVRARRCVDHRFSTGGNSSTIGLASNLSSLNRYLLASYFETARRNCLTWHKGTAVASV
mmetsp:Transcript_41684/g.98899  ORF Transcript_41684/g.98899 Transcript_41684/m.98899 type:complete len:350 (+) Transcript_41684:1525-2574(+)